MQKKKITINTKVVENYIKLICDKNVPLYFIFDYFISKMKQNRGFSLKSSEHYKYVYTNNLKL